MNELIQKMVTIEEYLAHQKGDFKLFALFLRDGSPGRWDVLVSAPWIDADKQQALKIITEQLTTRLNKDELISLSRVVIIKQDNEGLSAVYQFLPAENEIAEIYDKNFFGLDIKQAFLISPSKKSLSLPTNRLVKQKTWQV